MVQSNKPHKQKKTPQIAKSFKDFCFLVSTRIFPGLETYLPARILAFPGRINRYGRKLDQKYKN